MFANAANVGGWNLSNRVAQGASTVYDATKNVVINGKDFVKDSFVKIKPTASQVSKVLARGGAGYALSVAVEQLLGAVDWVLDPANNRIVYTEQYAGRDLALYKPRCLDDVKAYASNLGVNPNNLISTYRVVWPSGNQNANYAVCQGILYSGQNYRTIAEYPITGDDGGEKSIPLDTVSSQVISNAESSSDQQIKAGAQVATTAAAADIVAEAETDDTKARPIANQAEANAQTKPADEAEAEKANEAQGQTKPNEANPEATDISLEFPVFCNWAPTICEAAQVVISFPNTLTGWYNDTKTKAGEWAASITEAYHDFLNDYELPNEDTKVDITEHPVPELKEDAISWSAACPADVSVPISMQGVTSTLIFSWSPWCELLSYIKPAIVASAYIGAAFIVLGLRT